eukprot:COSAG01_NODE_34_length_34978_cov_45.798475_27_plen_517_part_00
MLIGSCALAPLALCDGDGTKQSAENTFSLVISRPSNLTTKRHDTTFPSLETLSEWSVLAADPRQSIRNGSAIRYLVDGVQTYAIVQDARMLGARELFAAFDADHSGYLEAPEVWELRWRFLKPFMPADVFRSSQRSGSGLAPSGPAVAAALARDDAGRVNQTALFAFMQVHPDVQLTHRLFVVTRAPASPPPAQHAAGGVVVGDGGGRSRFDALLRRQLHASSAEPEASDPDEVEWVRASLARRSRTHERVVPVSAIRSVGLSWTIPWMGLPACPGLSIARLLDPSLPEDPTLDTVAAYLFAGIFALSVHSRSIWPLTRLRSDERVTHLVSGWGLLPLVVLVQAADPFSLVASWTLVSTRCLCQVYFLYMISRPAAGRWASLVEYFIARSVAVGPPWAWLNAVPSALVRCPICRVLTSKDTAVQGVFAVEHTQCCVCLVETASVCLACGHLCLCGGCLGELTARANCLRLHRSERDDAAAPDWRRQRRPHAVAPLRLLADGTAAAAAAGRHTHAVY